MRPVLRRSKVCCAFVFSLMLAANMHIACAPRSAGPRQLPSVAQSIDEARSLAARGQAAHDAGKLDDAIELYRGAVRAYPEFGAAWNNMGTALMARAGQGDFVEAQQALQRAAAILPDDPTPSRNLGLLYQQRGFAKDACAHFEQALEIDPFDRDSLRGFVACGKQLRRADVKLLEVCKRAKLSESDPAWRAIMDREYLRIENDLREAAERGARVGS